MYLFIYFIGKEYVLCEITFSCRLYYKFRCFGITLVVNKSLSLYNIYLEYWYTYTTMCIYIYIYTYIIYIYILLCVFFVHVYI